MTSLPSTHAPSPLERAARPLLRLARVLTGAESTFVTSIDWDGQSQSVLYALNEGAIDLPEGVTVDWRDSLCRSLFLCGQMQTSAVGTDVPGTPGATALGITTFFAFPILNGDRAIGTVCGASRGRIVLDETQMESMQLIADALQQLLEVERENAHIRVRAVAAERSAEDARDGMLSQALYSQQMEHLAYTDALTGLPNRRAFIARWEDELARSGRRHYQIGLLLLDADRFKAVNDTQGHAKGDEVLRAIGATLMTIARSPDVVARLGGDEFALVTTHSDESHLRDVADRIRSEFARATVELGVDTTLSIGMVSSENSARELMLANADNALYRCKDAGGDTSRMFTSKTARDLDSASEVETDADQAID